jgi:dTDP-4-dehydrorhamnose reductase
MAALQEPRPEYSVLSVEKLERILGRKLEGWEEGAERYLEENAETLKR